jgi:hypothetical protein
MGNQHSFSNSSNREFSAGDQVFDCSYTQRDPFCCFLLAIHELELVFVQSAGRRSLWLHGTIAIYHFPYVALSLICLTSNASPFGKYAFCRCSVLYLPNPLTVVTSSSRSLLTAVSWFRTDDAQPCGWEDDTDAM